MHAILATAASVGATTIDTAAAYGESEAVIGDVLGRDPGLARVLWPITKLSPLDGWLQEPDDTVEERVRRSVDESRRRLRLDALPLLLLHRPSQLTARDGLVWRTLGRLVEEGSVEHRGVSVYHPDEALDAIADEHVAAVQVPVNPLDARQLDAGVPEAAARAGTALFARSVFLQGLLVADDPPDRGYPEALRPYLDAFRRVASARGASPASLAVSFARSLPAVTGLVIGAETPEQVRASAALWRDPPLAPEERDDLLRELGRPAAELVDPSTWA